ncbi:MAG: toll/interleukin-1 receptor domain-containing protein [Vicinamibacterales bacterium]
MGLVLPSSDDTALVDAVEGVVQAANVETRRLAWPPRLDGRTIDWLQSCDFVVADVGPAGQSTGLAAYLHGQFIPTLRLRSTSGDAVASSSLEDALYGAYEVGFPKDVVRWSSRDDLLPEIARRLDRILQEGRRIGSTPEARSYFQEAALRKEAVFLSYSGRDEDLVAPIAAALRRRFQSVFDYRDGGDSIEPGRPWMDEIFSKLDRAAVAVLALSPTYLASGNCAHEARSAVAAHDGGKVALLPIKLRRDDVLELPPFLTDVQYVRAWEQTGPDAIVDRIVNAVEKQAV